MVAFVSGTKQFFNQSSAPTGWTISTSNTDYTLRIVSGATGGTLNNSANFSTTMTDGKVFVKAAATTTATLSSNSADLPAHTHTYSGRYASGTTSRPYAGGPVIAISVLSAPSPAITAPGGTGTAHSHPIGLTSSYGTSDTVGNFGVQYLDFILATKN